MLVVLAVGYRYAKIDTHVQSCNSNHTRKVQTRKDEQKVMLRPAVATKRYRHVQPAAYDVLKNDGLFFIHALGYYAPILGLYWIASATWLAAMVSLSAKSAILRASLRTR